MAGSLSKNLTHSPSSHAMKNMEHEVKKVVTEKQGIVAILGPSDSERTKADSLRRTLSADMSSKKWLAHHGFSPMKKIASSEELSVSVDIRGDNTSSSSEDEDHYQERKEKFHIWSSIGEGVQKQKMNKAEAPEKQGQLDLWSSIVCQKANEEQANKSVHTEPYVHPLVKKKSSSLTVKSLEVCTESLGSETGSEGFSSYPPSETGEIEVLDKDQEAHAVVQQTQEEEKEKVQVAQAFYGEEFRVVKYNAAASKKLSPTRSFPPPLPSLSGCDGASVRMRTCRDNGRLVVQAVSMPSANTFRAQRQDGRLVLTFLATSPSSCEEPKIEEVVDEEEQSREEEFEEKFVNFEEGEEEKESEKSFDDEEDEESDEVEQAKKENGRKEIEMAMEEAPKVLTSRVTNVHRLALMMNKPIGLANKTHGWGNKFNQVVKYGVDDEEVGVVEPTPLAKSLPPRPGSVARLIPKPQAATKTAAATASFNAYEYYWRTKPTTTVALNPLPQLTSQSLKSNSFMSKNQSENEQQQMLALRGNKGDHLAPFSKGCKEPRRSLLFWEPYCIATS